MVFGSGFRGNPANPGWPLGCVFGYRFRLRLANPGWGLWCLHLGLRFVFTPPVLAGVLGGVLLCAGSASTPPFQAGISGARVRAWVWLYSANCASAVCVCAFGLCLQPANPGWVVWVCAFLCALRQCPAIPSSGVRCGCVCYGSDIRCAPPFLTGVLGCVCWCVPVAFIPPILAGVCGACVWVYVLALTPPILARVLGCVSSCARSACTPPILAVVCDVGVCAWVPVSAVLRHACLGFVGVYVRVEPPPVPRQSWPGCAVW